MIISISILVAAAVVVVSKGDKRETHLLVLKGSAEAEKAANGSDDAPNGLLLVVANEVVDGADANGSEKAGVDDVAGAEEGEENENTSRLLLLLLLPLLLL